MRKPTYTELERESNDYRFERNVLIFLVCFLGLFFFIFFFFPSADHRYRELKQENLALKEQILISGIDFPLTNVTVKCNDTHGRHIWHWNSLDEGTYLYYMTSGVCEVLP